jgi:hypothetical protein
MAVVVAGGSGRGVGKTALVCGVIAALPEFGWVAVKITSHRYAGLPSVYEELHSEESNPAELGSRELAAEECAGEESNEEESGAGESAGMGSDTVRYLAAGARRAFLVTATDDDFDERLSDLRRLLGAEANLIFESNRVLRFLVPDLCLAVEPEADAFLKPSYFLLEREKDASVRRAAKGSAEQLQPGTQPVFELAEFERLSEPMQQWLRERLNPGAQWPAAHRPGARRQAQA